MPFVLVMPKDARDALRKGGGIPESFWRDISGKGDGPILAWPHELNYDEELNSDGKERPVDVSAFFGLGGPDDDAATRRANERLLAPLLRWPMVLVAFLDEQEQSAGYVRFHSFSQIAKWIKRLEKAVEERYDAEPTLRDVTRTLVLVARQEQVRVDDNKDLTLFSECIGAGRVFRSAYYMGRKTQMAGGGLFHTWGVWDIILARLLMAFVLSKDHSRPFYEKPGLKIWRSADCVEQFDAAKEDEAINLALSSATRLLGKKLVPSSASDLPSAYTANCNQVNWADIPSCKRLKEDLARPLKLGEVESSSKAAHEKWRREPKWGWSDFNAQDCLEKTRDDNGERWRNALNAMRRFFPGWRRKKREAAAAEELRERQEIYAKVHESAASIQNIVSELRGRWTIAMKPDPVTHWEKMAEAEICRVVKLEELADDTIEFERARTHYPGLGRGVGVWSVVTLALGWAGYGVAAALAALFGKSAEWRLAMSLGVSVCVALGAFAALLIVILKHSRAGTKGMEELIKKSLEADLKLVERDEEARAIILEGVADEFGGSIRAERFRAWVLLKRLYCMLEKELSPNIVKGRPNDIEKTAAGAGASASTGIQMSDDDVKARSDFLKETRTECVVNGLTTPNDIQAFAAKETEKWQIQTFIPFWRELSRGDSRDAGHYPARETVPKLRSLMDGFIQELRKAWREENLSHGTQSMVDQVEVWRESFWNVDPLRYASAASTGMHTAEANIEPATIYYNKDVIGDLKKQETDNVINDGTTPRGGYSLMPVSSLKNTRFLGLMYQEWSVEFERDSNSGKLCFKGMPDG